MACKVISPDTLTYFFHKETVFHSKSVLPIMFWLKLNPKGFISVPSSFVYTSEEIFPLYLGLYSKTTGFRKFLLPHKWALNQGFCALTCLDSKHFSVPERLI